jgi:hypothetical protein
MKRTKIWGEFTDSVRERTTGNTISRVRGNDLTERNVNSVRIESHDYMCNDLYLKYS